MRWTEQRNFEAVLGLLADQKIDTKGLATHRFALADAAQAYNVLTTESYSLGILLEYPETAEASQSVRLVDQEEESASLKGGGNTVSFIGAGNYASRVLIPAFRGAGAKLATLVSARGVTASHHGSKHGFLRASTDVASAISEPNVDAVVIATPHNQHGEQVLDALRAGKHVFCEKPLCLNIEELNEISAEAKKRPEQLLMVGFNRRFAPTVAKARSLLEGITEPLALIATVNAGEIPREHWTQDRRVGGGRIIGEACHFIDLLRYLAGSRIVSTHAEALGGIVGSGPPDNASVTLRFENGSVGTIHYLSRGNKSFPKERIEVFGGGTVLQIDNFRQVRVWGHKDFPTLSLLRQDKGNVACAGRFVEAIRTGGSPPIPLDEILEVSRWSITVAESLEQGASENQ